MNGASLTTYWIHNVHTYDMDELEVNSKRSEHSLFGSSSGNGCCSKKVRTMTRSSWSLLFSVCCLILSVHSFWYPRIHLAPKRKLRFATSFRLRLAPRIKSVSLRTNDTKISQSFYGYDLGLETSTIEDTLKVVLPGGTQLFLREDKTLLHERPRFTWEPEMYLTREFFDNLLREVEAGPYAHAITDEDRQFEEFQEYKREILNCRAFADGNVNFLPFSFLSLLRISLSFYHRRMLV